MISVKNYYKMTSGEIESAMRFVQNWLFDNPHSQHIPKMLFALKIILNAKQVKSDLDKDQYIRDVVDNLF